MAQGHSLPNVPRPSSNSDGAKCSAKRGSCYRAWPALAACLLAFLSFGMRTPY
jgi:hypothetical protein